MIEEIKQKAFLNAIEMRMYNLKLKYKYEKFYRDAWRDFFIEELMDEVFREQLLELQYDAFTLNRSYHMYSTHHFSMEKHKYKWSFFKRYEEVVFPKLQKIFSDQGYDLKIHETDISFGMKATAVFVICITRIR